MSGPRDTDGPIDGAGQSPFAQLSGPRSATFPNLRDIGSGSAGAGQGEYPILCKYSAYSQPETPSRRPQRPRERQQSAHLGRGPFTDGRQATSRTGIFCKTQRSARMKSYQLHGEAGRFCPHRPASFAVRTPFGASSRSRAPGRLQQEAMARCPPPHAHRLPLDPDPSPSL